MELELDEFIRGLPKAELHIHLEGSLEPEMMLTFARRNGIDIGFATVEAIRNAYNFTSLQEFLDIYYNGAKVLIKQIDFHELTIAYLHRAAADNVKHAEVFFDPQSHTARGVSFKTVVDGILSAMAEAYQTYGITTKLIMCFLRHLTEEEAFDTLRLAEPYLEDYRIAGVGLDSTELGNPPEKFKNLFAAAGSRGLKRVAHCGEEGPPEYVRAALDLLGLDRVDHGNRSLEDESLTERLAYEGLTLTVCPLSNIRLKNCTDVLQHPIARMLRMGIRATVNSDDPAYFGGYINDNYRVIAALVSQDDIITLAKNSFFGSFLSQDEIMKHIGEIDSYVQRLKKQTQQ